MSTVRRNFFVVIDNSSVTRPVTRDVSAAKPRPILTVASTFEPARPVPQRESAAQVVRPFEKAFAKIVRGLPADLFDDWLAGGLRMVESCKPGGRIWRAMQIEAAMAREQAEE